MVDISMCNDSQCPAKFECRRHTASGTKPGERQSYADFAWTGDCDGFWKVTKQEIAK